MSGEDAGARGGLGVARGAAGLERELAVLQRYLEGLGRRSDVYRGMATGRAGYLLLMTLAEAGPSTNGALATMLGLDASTVTRQIAAMESEGLVERRGDPRDRRCAIISATDRGRALTRRVRRRRVERMGALVGEWSAEDRAALERLLARLNAAIAASPEVGAAGEPRAARTP